MSSLMGSPSPPGLRRGMFGESGGGKQEREPLRALLLRAQEGRRMNRESSELGHLELRREGMPAPGAARGPGVGRTGCRAAGPELQVLKAGCLAGASLLWNKQPTTLFKTEKLDHLIFILPGRGTPTLEGQGQGPGPGSSNPCPWGAGVLPRDSSPPSS